MGDQLVQCVDSTCLSCHLRPHQPRLSLFRLRCVPDQGRPHCTAAPPEKQADKPTRALTLDTPVAVNGENFSQDQRHVLSIARAVGRRSKVVLLDEATASVDHETDMHMQRLLRSIFPESTILASVHRLRTIMDYDRVLVMAEGETVENGCPANLIKKQGVFWSMLKNTGEYDELVQMVRE